MLLTKLLNYVATISLHYGVDDSHGWIHSLNTLRFADKIYKSEIRQIPELVENRRVIYAGAILHDMCDKKYFDDADVELEKIGQYLQGKCLFTERETALTQSIISRCSYAHVEKHGYPQDLRPVDLKAFHAVREADLLTSYDVERSLLYQTRNQGHTNIRIAFGETNQFFQSRAFRLKEKDLFTTEYARGFSSQLHAQSMARLWEWKLLIDQIEPLHP